MEILNSNKQRSKCLSVEGFNSNLNSKVFIWSSSFEIMKIAILTSGGLAPCLSSAVGYLIETYSQKHPDVEIICYLNGYRGLLLGDSIEVTPDIRKNAMRLQHLGGSPIGNSRVKLKNVEDCIKRGLVKEGECPERVAAVQLIKDGITVLHTIGGDDTNLSAGDLSNYLRNNFGGYKLVVLGLPKTIDNDVFPVSITLGATTAAEQGALFFANIVAEHSASTRTLTVHEIMGRSSGWLAAKTAKIYTDRNSHEFPGLVSARKSAVHAVYIPEVDFDIQSEASRLAKIMDSVDAVNVFISEGALTDTIVQAKKKSGEKIVTDAFGHVKLDTLSPGKWFADAISDLIGAEKILVQKSGYFCRSAASNDFDRCLINRCAVEAVRLAEEGCTGLVGPDQQNSGEISCIDYKRVSGGKPFDLKTPWYVELMAKIGQPIVPLNKKRNPPFYTYELESKVPRVVSSNNQNGERSLGKVEEAEDEQLSASTTTVSQTDCHLVCRSTVSLKLFSSDEKKLLRGILSKKFNEESSRGLVKVLGALIICFKNISSACKDVQGRSGSSYFKKMANAVFENTLGSVESVQAMASLDTKGAIQLNNGEKSRYGVLLDPADGASNIDLNVSIGSIFGVVENRGRAGGEDFLCQKGTDLLLAGYCLYGSATIMMLSFGDGVYGFILDYSNNQFVLTHTKLKIPSDGRFFSANDSYSNHWSDPVKRYLVELKNKKRSLRYIGTFVADIHRTILYGGVFLYPPNNKNKNGKLKLAKEVHPIAFLVEQAGGKAVDCSGRRLLSLCVRDLEERSSVVIGSKVLVEDFEKILP